MCPRGLLGLRSAQLFVAGAVGNRPDVEFGFNLPL
jgi:hypothetical protein